MLLIGTAISIVTAVAATRAMLGLLAGFRWFDSPKFMGATGAEDPALDQQIDYIGKRNIWFAISGVVRSLISVVSRRRAGAEPRDRLRGRHADHVHDAAARRRSRTCARGGGGDRRGGRVIQGAGEESSGDAATDRSRSARSPRARRAARADARPRARRRRDRHRVKNVSSSFGRQIAQAAPSYAVIVSLSLIVLYITMRFQWKFARP